MQGLDHLETKSPIQELKIGLNYLVRQVPYEVFTYDERREKQPMVYEETPKDLFPYMVISSSFNILYRHCDSQL